MNCAILRPVAYGPHEELRQLLYDKRISVTAAAKTIGISRNRLSYMLNGKTRMTEWVASALRKLLGVRSGVPLVAREGTIASLGGMPLSPLPLVGGVPIDTSYRIDAESSTIWIPSTLAPAAAFAFIVPDDSMMPVLEPGAVAVFAEASQPRRGYSYLIGDRVPRIRTVEWSELGWMGRGAAPDATAEIIPAGAVKGLLVGWYRCAGTRDIIDLDPSGLLLLGPRNGSAVVLGAEPLPPPLYETKAN